MIFDSFCLLKTDWSKWNLEHFFSTEIDKKSGASVLPLFNKFHITVRQTG
ncbi:hypothetical protein THZG08_500005 [Vibrio owensii]|nr:hypothetical protein THZG08_500005 [Vibrio owensii]CAH1561276.1 hypothetical protein THZB04_140067 [Vibrio owensii]CAH1580256.1 hypothetical protein THOD04_200069 [Vibrio owensii]CAH1583725.1 hypothetical protein THOA03_500004 [Vibrio owensii]